MRLGVWVRGVRVRCSHKRQTSSRVRVRAGVRVRVRVKDRVRDRVRVRSEG